MADRRRIGQARVLSGEHGLDNAAHVAVAASGQHGARRQSRGGEDVLGLARRRWNSRSWTVLGMDKTNSHEGDAF